MFASSSPKSSTFFCHISLPPPYQTPFVHKTLQPLQSRSKLSEEGTWLVCYLCRSSVLEADSIPLLLALLSVPAAPACRLRLYSLSSR